MINRAELKLRSKELIRNTVSPKPINVSLLYMAIIVVLSVLSMRLVTPKISQNEMMKLIEHVDSGNVEYVVNYVMEYTPSTFAQLLNTVLGFVSYIVSAGFIIFCLNIVRNTEACFENLLDGFADWWKLILLNILIGLFVALWSMLLIVPGIIASYRYRQAVYILLDNPQLSPMDCLRESKRMMHGHKWELFVLDLSFIGWKLLSGIYVIGWVVGVWTTPYFGFTYALYYEQLKALSHGGYGANDPYGQSGF